MEIIYIGYEESTSSAVLSCIGTGVDCVFTITLEGDDFAYLICNNIFDKKLQVKRGSKEGSYLAQKLEDFYSHDLMNEKRRLIENSIHEYCDELVLEKLSLNDIKNSLKELRKKHIAEGRLQRETEIKLALAQTNIFI